MLSLKESQMLLSCSYRVSVVLQGLLRHSVNQSRISSSNVILCPIDNVTRDDYLYQPGGGSDSLRRSAGAKQNSSGVQPLGGLRTAVISNVVHRDEITRGKAQFTRYKALNDVLGGFRLGEFTIFSGRSGVGKTTFLAEYCLDLAMQNVRTLFCSFEMLDYQIVEKLFFQYLRKDSSFLDNADAELIEQKYDEMSRGLNETFFLFKYDPEEPHIHPDGKKFNKAEYIIRNMKQTIEMNNIDHLVIDNLQYLVGAADYTTDKPFVDVMGSRFRIQDNFIRSLRTLSRHCNVHITLVIHPRKESSGVRNVRLTMDSIYGGGRAVQEADNVMIIQKMSVPVDGTLVNKKFLSIFKNRHCGHTVDDDSFRLDFNQDTKCYQLVDESKELPSAMMSDES